MQVVEYVFSINLCMACFVAFISANYCLHENLSFTLMHILHIKCHVGARGRANHVGHLLDHPDYLKVGVWSSGKKKANLSIKNNVCIERKCNLKSAEVRVSVLVSFFYLNVVFLKQLCEETFLSIRGPHSLPDINPPSDVRCHL